MLNNFIWFLNKIEALPCFTKINIYLFFCRSPLDDIKPILIKKIFISWSIFEYVCIKLYFIDFLSKYFGTNFGNFFVELSRLLSLSDEVFSIFDHFWQNLFPTIIITFFYRFRDCNQFLFSIFVIKLNLDYFNHQNLYLTIFHSIVKNFIRIFNIHRISADKNLKKLFAFF